MVPSNYPGGNSSGGSDIIVVADVTPTSWGSKISLRMNNVPDGYSCSMVVWGTDGRREPDGNWTAPAGQTTFTSRWPTPGAGVRPRFPPGSRGPPPALL